MFHVFKGISFFFHKHIEHSLPVRYHLIHLYGSFFFYLLRFKTFASYVHTCLHVCSCVAVHTCTWVCIRLCVYACMCICACSYGCISGWRYMFMCVYNCVQARDQPKCPSGTMLYIPLNYGCDNPMLVGCFPFFLWIGKPRIGQQIVHDHQLEIDKIWILSQLDSNSVSQVKHFCDLNAAALSISCWELLFVCLFDLFSVVNQSSVCFQACCSWLGRWLREWNVWYTRIKTWADPRHSGTSQFLWCAPPTQPSEVRVSISGSWELAD